MNMDIDKVWGRCANLPQFKGMVLNDFRHLSFILQQHLAASAVGVPTVVGPLRTEFPAGGIIVSIAAAARPDLVDDQEDSCGCGLRNIAIEMEYSNNERITAGGRVIAEALLGSGVYSDYPSKELVVPPNQTVLTTLENLAPIDMFYTQTFNCLVPRLSS